MIMGRKTMEIISSMNLSPEQWFYGDLKIMVLSNHLKMPPANMIGKVELYSGDIVELVDRLENEGFKHAYIDGGTTIRTFLEMKLVNEITLTQIPVLLGQGISLFGKNNAGIQLEEATAIAFPNDFVQIKYQVKYN
jgi:dihydrofolate reductase